jgi:ABC-2 type transport system permease protein
VTGTVQSVGPVPGWSHALACEWTKLRSVRSTYWLLLIGAAASVGLAVLITVGLGSGSVEVTGETFDAAGVSLLGVWFGQIAFAVVGVLAATGEYTTGSIRTTLTAVPRRGRLLGGKLAVVGVTGYAVGTAVSVLAFLAGQAVLADQDRAVGLGDPGVAVAVFGTGAYLGAMAVVGVAVGVLLRHTVAAVLTVLGLGLGPSLLGGLLPDWLLDYMPGPIGSRIAATEPPATPGDAVALVAWVAVLVVLAAVVLNRRDA